MSENKTITINPETLALVWQDGSDAMRAKIIRLLTDKQKNYTKIGFFEKADAIETLIHQVKEIVNE